MILRALILSTRAALKQSSKLIASIFLMKFENKQYNLQLNNLFCRKIITLPERF